MIYYSLANIIRMQWCTNHVSSNSLNRKIWATAETGTSEAGTDTGHSTGYETTDISGRATQVKMGRYMQ